MEVDGVFKMKKRERNISTKWDDHICLTRAESFDKSTEWFSFSVSHSYKALMNKTVIKTKIVGTSTSKIHLELRIWKWTSWGNQSIWRERKVEDMVRSREEKLSKGQKKRGRKGERAGKRNRKKKQRGKEREKLWEMNWERKSRREREKKRETGERKCKKKTEILR